MPPASLCVFSEVFDFYCLLWLRMRKKKDISLFILQKPRLDFSYHVFVLGMAIQFFWSGWHGFFGCKLELLLCFSGLPSCISIFSIIRSLIQFSRLGTVYFLNDNGPWWFDWNNERMDISFAWTYGSGMVFCIGSKLMFAVSERVESWIAIAGVVKLWSSGSSSVT